jgi:hypothetical protein
MDSFPGDVLEFGEDPPPYGLCIYMHGILGCVSLLRVVLSETVLLSRFSANGDNFRDQLVSLGAPYPTN